ncbi:MAG: SdrD B-like domain-containing protein [Chloroflexota bacterium]
MLQGLHHRERVVQTHQLGLDIAANTRVRLEFSGLPTWLETGASGTDSQTSVVFTNVSSSGTTVVNYAVNNPGDYCHSNPRLATSCYRGGNLLLITDDVFIDFPYYAGSGIMDDSQVNFMNPTTHDIVVPSTQLGATYGQAFHRTSNSYLVGALVKRTASLGPLGNESTGAIYRVDSQGNATVFMDLNDVAYFGPDTTGANPHPNATTDLGRDGATFDAVGKIGIGDMDMAEDDQTLYLINLADRSLYAIPVTGNPPVAPPVGTIISHTVPTALPGANQACPASDVRPFGLGIQDGIVYVGMVCSGESSPTADTYIDTTANGRFNLGSDPFTDNDGNGTYTHGDVRDLVAYVYAFDPATNMFGMQPALEFPLDYLREDTNVNGLPANWNGWSDDFDDSIFELVGGVGMSLPQPIVSDIEFQGADMIIALRDRFGDQSGTAGLSPTHGDFTLYFPFPAGDILRACSIGNGAWEIEGAASCPVTTIGGAANSGPGGPEHYFEDKFGINANPNHDETVLGGLVQIPGLPDIAAAVYDPQMLSSNSNVGHDEGGIRWFNNATGASTRGYVLYEGTAANGFFGKAAGLGDLEANCRLAPLEIGNLIWLDENDDGIQGPEDQPLANVLVQLTDITGTVIATATTNALGHYFFIDRLDSRLESSGIFSNIIPSHYGVVLTSSTVGGLHTNTDYRIQINLAQSSVYTYRLAKANVTGNSTLPLEINNKATQVSNQAVITLTTGSGGQNAHYFDIGFVRPDVAVAKFDTPNVVQPGQTLAYTIRFENRGNQTINAITITDQLPIGVDSASFTYLGAHIIVSPTLQLVGTSAISNPMQSGSIITWTGQYGSGLPGGALGYLTYTVTISDPYTAMSQMLHNVVSITTDQTDNITSNNIFTQVTPLAGLVLEKATNGFDADLVTGPSIQIGRPVTWTYVVTNTGVVTLTHLFVQDHAFGNTITTTPVITLAAGESYTFTEVSLAQVSGQYTNTATVNGTATVSEIDAFDNIVTTQIILTDTDPSHYFGIDPAIALEKHTNNVDADLFSQAVPVTEGAIVTWTYHITNSGNVALINLDLLDNREGNITCPQTSLAVGLSITCVLTSTAGDSAYANTAVVTATGIYTDPVSSLVVTTLVTDTDPSHYLPRGLDLALRKTVSSGVPQPFLSGETVTFTLGITNQGTLSATNIVLVDYIPDGLILNDANWNLSHTTNGPQAQHTLSGVLVPGAGTAFDIVFTIAPTFTGLLTNTAEISAATDIHGLPQIDRDSDLDSINGNHAGEIDPLLINDEINQPGKSGGDEDDHDIAHIMVDLFDLALQKRLEVRQNYQITPNETVAFAITLYNQGTLTATNVTITDYLPPHTQLNDAQWADNGATATRTLNNLNLAPGLSTTIEINLLFNAAITISNIYTNIAEITSASDAQGRLLTDVDSTADAIETNDGSMVDDEILGQAKQNPGEDEDDHDFAEVELIANSIGDYVWLDDNRDGIQNDDQGLIRRARPGVPNVQVNLYTAAGTLVATTTTNINGYYLFSNPGVNTYWLQFFPPVSYTITMRDAGTDDTVDSDIDPLTGRTTTTTLVASEHDFSWDAGLYRIDPRIDLDKSASATFLSSGQTHTITYTLIVTNNGNIALDQVTITDTLTANLSYVANSATLTPTVVNSQTLVWQNVNQDTPLEPGQSVEITYQAHTLSQSGRYTNSAVVVGTYVSGVNYPDGDVEDTDSVTVVYEIPDIDVMKFLNSSPVQGILSFTIVISNIGPTEIDILPVQDIFTGPLTYVGGSPAADVIDTDGQHLMWHDITNHYGNLLPRQQITMTTIFSIASNQANFTAINTVHIPEDTVTDIYTTTVPTPVTDTVVIINIPSAVDLTALSANWLGEYVQIRWETAIETDNFGFRLFRSQTNNLNDAIEIAFLTGKGQGTSSGATYVYLDQATISGQSYTYWLIDVDLYGVETIHGPISTNRLFDIENPIHTYFPLIMQNLGDNLK